MSDPKTSPADFTDRVILTLGCCVICLLVALVWAVRRIPVEDGLLPRLVSLCSPVAACGAVALLAALVPSFVPFSRLSAPLNVTIPIVWGLMNWLIASALTTAESSTSRVPAVLAVVSNWTEVGTFLPVGLAQFGLLTIPIAFRRKE